MTYMERTLLMGSHCMIAHRTSNVRPALKLNQSGNHYPIRVPSENENLVNSPIWMSGDLQELLPCRDTVTMCRSLTMQLDTVPSAL